MLIHRFEPRDPFHTMDLLFDAMLPRGGRARIAPPSGKLKLREQDASFTLSAELPGVAADELELEVGEDWVELTARRESAVPEGYQPLRRERPRIAIQRRIQLSKRIDGERVEAELRDGVLRVTLPKHASVAPRQITVHAA